MADSFLQMAGHLKRLSDINYAAGLLQWDQEVYMPPKGAEIRAQQLATLSGLAHETGTDAELGRLLESLTNDPSLNDKQRRNVKEAFRKYNDRLKYPNAFVM
jgi:carboxypeptidase Taq